MSVEDVEFRLRALEEESARNLDAHKEFHQKFDKINIAQAKIDAQYTNILSTLAEMKAAVEEIRSKPAKKWDTATTAIITGVVGFLMALMLGG